MAEGVTLSVSPPSHLDLQYLLVVLAVLGDHVPEHADSVIDAAAILLLDQVVHLALAGLLWGVGVRAEGRGGRREARLGI